MTQTSGSREESMKASEQNPDPFGEENSKLKRKASTQADGTKERSEPDGELDPSTSGTTPLTGEPKSGDVRPGPGGVEGESGNS